MAEDRTKKIAFAIGYVIAEWMSLLHQLAQVMGYNSLATPMVSGQGTQGDLQRATEESRGRVVHWPLSWL